MPYQGTHEVETHEATREPASDAEAGEVWVCLRVVLDDATLYLGYRLGEGHVLTATAAHRLAFEIEARAGQHLAGDGAPGSSQPAGSLPPYRLRKVRAYVREHLGEPITVAQLAAEARMSSAHFARLFKQTLDQTPMQYVATCRVEEAKRLLRTTELKVEAVARQVGLRSASHFAEVFRRLVGMTPRAYRNGHRA